MVSLKHDYTLSKSIDFELFKSMISIFNPSLN